MPSPEIRVHTSLRHAAASPRTAAEIEALRRRAWIEMGVVVLVPAELADDWLRQGLINEATRRYGRRMKR